VNLYFSANFLKNLAVGNATRNLSELQYLVFEALFWLLIRANV